MKEQTIVYCEDGESSERKIKSYLKEGWFITHVVAESVSVSDTSKSGTWESGVNEITGGFIFVLERQRN